MNLKKHLSVDIGWLGEIGPADDEWMGPGSRLVNLPNWIKAFADFGHVFIVKAAFGAAKAALPEWNQWELAAPEFARESLGDSSPPDKQLQLVAEWLREGDQKLVNEAYEMIDHTKQLYWFHEEYEDTWFDYPGMWAIEAAEFCTLSLVYGYKKPMYAQNEKPQDQAVISIICSLNSFRRSVNDSWNDPLVEVVSFIQKEMEA